MYSCLKKRDEEKERNSRYKPLEHVFVGIAFLGPDVIAEHLSKRKSLDGSCLVSRKICSRVSRETLVLKKNVFSVFSVFKYLQYQ